MAQPAQQSIPYTPENSQELPARYAWKVAAANTDKCTGRNTCLRYSKSPSGVGLHNPKAVYVREGVGRIIRKNSGVVESDKIFCI